MTMTECFKSKVLVVLYVRGRTTESDPAYCFACRRHRSCGSATACITDKMHCLLLAYSLGTLFL